MNIDYSEIIILFLQEKYGELGFKLQVSNPIKN
jgi:hypothetical protein